MREINDNTIVEVWSNHRSSISYVTDKVTRTWHTPGSMKKIKVDELYEACNSPGGKKFFNEGVLLIKDNEVRERLDLPPLDKFVLDRKEMFDLIKSGNFKEIEEFLQYCSNMLLSTFVQIAIEVPVSDLSIAKLIGKYAGIDILSVIAERQEEAVGKKDQKEFDNNSGRPRRIAKE